MTATTLPLSFPNHRSGLSEYDEFGAHNFPPVKAGDSDWDEEVVPALRRRLEEESHQLDQRLSRLDAQKRPHIRPAPRVDRNNEVIFDGLGSDDLIPSEWVTGSSAQFATISPRTRPQQEEMSRSVSSSQYQLTAPFHTPPLHISPATLIPPSPTTPVSPSASSPRSFYNEPPSPTTGDVYQTVSRARERARRLAKEKEKLNLEVQMQRGTPDEWQEGIRDEEETEAAAESRERNRTLSTPNAYKPEIEAVRAKQVQVNAQNLNAPLKKSVSKASLRDENVPASKIPLPTSGSMSKYQDNYSPPQDMRKSKSAAPLSILATPPHQDGVEYSSVSHLKSKATSEDQRRVVKRSPYEVDNSPPTQDVLDEFGPLGGTPKGKRWPGGGGEDGAQTEAERSRSVSNPWDEEMLPTVKKRLAQQKIIEDLSRDEGLVDTWDRHGLPLNRTQIMQKQRAREERERKVTAGSKDEEEEEQQQQKKKKKQQQQQQSQQSMSQPYGSASVDEEQKALRMKRLQEQLDLGIQQSHSHSHKALDTSQQVGHMGDEEVEMQQTNAPIAAQRSYTKPEAQAPLDQQRQAIDVRRESKMAHHGGEDAGCCKCTIM